MRRVDLILLCSFSMLVVLSCASCDRADSGSSAELDPASVVLDPEKQKRIWDLEHVTFQIEHYFGKPLRRALEAGEAEAIQALLRPRFGGAVLAGDGTPTKSKQGLRESRRERGMARSRPVGAEALVRDLLKRAEPFTSVRRSGLRVLSIDQIETTDRFQAKLLLYLLGHGAGGEPLEHNAIFDAQIEAANDDEFRSGQVLVGFDERSRTDRVGERELFEEVTDRVGLDALGLVDNWEVTPDLARNYRYQIAVADFDRDGFLDIAVGSNDGRARLLRSESGRRFVDVAAEVGLPARSSGEQKAVEALAGWIDYDADGDPDLLLGPRLWRNDEGRRFVDVTRESGLRFDLVPLGVTVLDYDVDGRLDLYISYQKGFRIRPREGARPWVGDEEAGASNRLWRNLGNGRFEDVTVASGAGGGMHQTFATAVFFYDEDHFPDLYIANDFGTNVLLRNRGDGRFEDLSGETGVADFATSMGVATGDLDDDGRAEVYVANMFSKMGRRIIAHVEPEDYPEGIYDQIRGSCAGNRLYTRDGDGFSEFSEEVGVNQVGWAFAPTMSDFDGDGRLDLYATTGFMSFTRGEPDG